MLVRRVDCGSVEYQQAVQLREEVLRKPLGRTLTAEELAADAERQHFVVLHEATVMGSVSSYFEMPTLLRIKQMAVAPAAQGQGVGAQLLSAAEQAGKSEGATRAKLHARRNAEAFYARLGYRTTSDEFIESGIPHVVMEKELR